MRVKRRLGSCTVRYWIVELDVGFCLVHSFNLNGPMALNRLALICGKPEISPLVIHSPPLHRLPQNWEMDIKMHKELRLFTWTLMRGGLSSLV